MEKDIVEEIIKECKNWKERMGAKLFSKLFIRIYKMGIKCGFNWENKR